MRSADYPMATFMAAHRTLVLIEIIDTKGSTPREKGTQMLVAEHAISGTIGGGQLEFLAIEEARRLLHKPDRITHRLDISLGPDIGQCCGGSVCLNFQHLDEKNQGVFAETLERERAKQPSVYVFGAGHVGLAICEALSLLPVKTCLIDSRTKFLQNLPHNIESVHTALPETVVRDAPAGSGFIILTHDHGLDFLITNEALARGDASYVGMIGSKTKRASFKNWLRQEGQPVFHLEALVCPIGKTAICDKRPSVIAALTVSELLATLFFEK